MDVDTDINGDVDMACGGQTTGEADAVIYEGRRCGGGGDVGCGEGWLWHYGCLRLGRCEGRRTLSEKLDDE